MKFGCAGATRFPESHMRAAAFAVAGGTYPHEPLKLNRRLAGAVAGNVASFDRVLRCWDKPQLDRFSL
jgi:hypothetical protein